MSKPLHILLLLAHGATWAIILGTYFAPHDVAIPETAIDDPTLLHFDILHTNDLHASLTGTGPDEFFNPDVGDGNGPLGHLARIGHLIADHKRAAAAAGTPVLTVDAGDFTEPDLLGHLSGATYESSLTNMQFYTRSGYDAVAIGNHEMFVSPIELNGLLGRGSNLTLLAANLVWDPAHWEDALYPFLQPTKSGGVRIRKTIVKELQSGDGRRIRVGIVGAWGLDALTVTRWNHVGVEGSGGGLAGVAAALQQHIGGLRRRRGLDVVVLLLHGGRGLLDEDGRIASLLRGVDVIVAGHTHERYTRAVLDRDGAPVIISQMGSHGEWVGTMHLAYSRAQRRVFVRRGTPMHVRVDDTVPLDPGHLADVEARFARAMLHRNVAEHYNRHVFTLAHLDLPKIQTWDMVGKQHYPASLLVADSLQGELDGVDLSFFGWAQIARGLVRVRAANGSALATPYRLSDIYRYISAGDVVAVFDLPCSSVRAMVGLAPIITSLISPIYGATFSSSLRYVAPRVPLVGDGFRVFWDELQVGGVVCRGNTAVSLATGKPTLVRCAASVHVVLQIMAIKDLVPMLSLFAPVDSDGVPLTRNQTDIELKCGTGLHEFELVARHLAAIGVM